MEKIVLLRKFRQKMKLTQKECAESIGIDQRQWSRYEQGVNEFPIRYLKALCVKYGISADEILGLNKESGEL